MTPHQRSERVCALADEAGLDAVGIAEAAEIGRRSYVFDWLERGRHGEMSYLARSAETRVDPRRLLDNARSVIVVAQSYKPHPHEEADAGGEGPRGRVARYAWGRDYHRVFRKKLHKLVDAIRAAIDEPFESRVCVDTAPIIEREWAASAGVGWIGKNTLALHPRLGSYFFLGEIVTTLALTPSAPMTDHCGSCTRCLEACPTNAFPTAYQLDATRCISYLTIEHRGAIPAELQPAMGDWIFGCDLCQEVCPFNRKAPPARESAYAPSSHFPLTPKPPLNTLLQLTEEQRQQFLSGSAMKRATLAMLQRNAAIALKNTSNSPA